MSDNYNNKAFISYSSIDKDIAKRLQDELEKFVIPPGICKVAKKKDHLGKIFRDRTDLQAGCFLTEGLKNELDNTEYLIVLCSENVRSSSWVNKEIDYFSNKPEKINNIIPFIVYSTPLETNISDCFPDKLIDINKRKDGILAADSRCGKDGWARALAKTISKLLGFTKLDDLIQRLQYAIELEKYQRIIDEIQIEIGKNNLDEAQNMLLSYINKEKTFNLAKVEFQFLLKKCNPDIGIHYVDNNITSIDYNDMIIVAGTVDGNVLIIDIVYGNTKIFFNAHSEPINSVLLLKDNLIITHVSNLDLTVIRLWDLTENQRLVWEISHPVSFPERIMNDDKYNIFKNFLISNKTSNMAVTPDGKIVIFSIGGYIAVADIKTSKIIYYVEMPQPIPVMAHINFVNEILIIPNLNYGVARSLHETIYWNIDTGIIINDLSEKERTSIDQNRHDNKSNLFKIVAGNNKIKIFERNKKNKNKDIKYYIHNSQGNNSLAIVKDQIILCDKYFKVIKRIEKNNCPFLMNFSATISECGNYIGIAKPSNMSEPGAISIYSTVNGEFLIKYPVENIFSHHLMRLITIHCIGIYVAKDFEVTAYFSDNSIRIFKKNRNHIYQIEISKQPSVVSFYNKHLIAAVYTDGSTHVFKNINDEWIRFDNDIKNISCATFTSEYSLVLGDTTGYLHLWRIDDNSLISRKIHIDKINCLLFIPNSERVILGCCNLIKVVLLNSYIENIVSLLDIKVDINPDNIYIDKNEIIIVEYNNGLETISISNIINCEQEIADEKLYYREILTKGK
uniref:TIR domain-containing protein n=1 Tax=Candidatus Electrothrix sp. TaxID=2170559 RepID=UPI004055A6D8